MCDDKTAQLAWSANITEVTGVMTIYHGTTSQKQAVVWDQVSPWDIIQTAGNSTGSIAFSDASILRLDTNTTVELSTNSNAAGESIAAIILADGQLWWRVLTSSGMDFGAGGYIAGVRGTSILLSKPKDNPTVTIAIIDSTNPIAATITNTNTPSKPSITINAGSKVIEQSGATLPPTEEASITKASLLAESSWVRGNTFEDIIYLSEKLPKTTWNQANRITNELNSATPSDTETMSELIGSTTTDAANLIKDNQDDNTSEKFTRLTKRIECIDKWKIYWKSLDNIQRDDYCQPKNLIAFVDYATKDNTLYFKDDSIKPDSTVINWWKYDISNYSNSLKSAVITFKNLPTSIQSTSPLTQYLFNSNIWWKIYVSNNNKYSILWISWNLSNTFNGNISKQLDGKDLSIIYLWRSSSEDNKNPAWFDYKVEFTN